MTLNETVLRKTADWRPSGGEKQTLSIPDDGSGWTVTVTANRCDELGCLVWELGLRRASAATETGNDAPRVWAEGAARRVTALLEPLKVVEVDLLKQEALLRSNEPVARAGASFYYEVHLKGNTEASVRRFQAARQGGQRREQVLFPLTHEALARVVSDLALAE